MWNKLYVGNLSHDIDDSSLEQMFSTYGTVNRATVINDCDTGRSRGFGFVEMNTEDETKAAITGLNGKKCGNSQLKVNKADPGPCLTHRLGCGAPF